MFQREIIDIFIEDISRTGLAGLLRQSPLHLQIPASMEMVEKLTDALLFSFMLGMDHAGSNIELADNIKLDILPEPVSFEQAMDFLKARIPISKKTYKGLESKLRFRAFSVARLSQYDAIDAIRQQLIKAQDEGKTLAQFLEDAGEDELLKKAGFHKSDPWYWETVFRTNIQTNYNAGRLMQFRENPPKMMEFVGILDSRQSLICRQRSGVRRPANDSWWSSNWPPLHFNCRSTVRGIDAAEAKALGLSVTPSKELKALVAVQKGFGGDPLETESFYRMTAEMKKRARQYGIEEEIKQAAKKLSVNY